MRILKCFLIFLFLGMTYNVSAQSGTGCYVASQNTIYIGGPVLGIYLFAGRMSTMCGSMATTTTPYYDVPFAGGSNCTAALSGGLLIGGKISNYTIKNCALDDYFPFLLLAAGGVGFYFLRKKDLRFG